MSSEVRLKTKELAEMFNIPQNQLISVFQFGRLEPERGDDGALTYLLDEFQDAYVDYQEKLKSTQIENAAELLKRIIPDIQQKVGETVEQKMVLVAAIRDSKEARLVEFLGTLSQLLVRLDSTLTYWVKMAAQLNNAAVAGLATQMPTSGVAGARFSLGVERGVAKSVAEEPFEDAFSSEATDRELAESASLGTPWAGQEAEPSQQKAEPQPGFTSTAAETAGSVPSYDSVATAARSGGKAVYSPTAKIPAKKSASASLADKLAVASPPPAQAGVSSRTGPAHKQSGLASEAKASLSRVQAVKGPAPSATKPPTAAVAESGAEGSLSAGYAQGAGSWQAGRSPLFASMLPPTAELSKAAEKVVDDNLSFIENFLALPEADMKALAPSDQNTVDEILKPWESLISDCPKFSTFYAAYSRIKEWVSAKSEKIPPLILFLAINRMSMGAINGKNFLYVTGLV